MVETLPKLALGIFMPLWWQFLPGSLSPVLILARMFPKEEGRLEIIKKGSQICENKQKYDVKVTSNTIHLHLLFIYYIALFYLCICIYLFAIHKIIYY